MLGVSTYEQSYIDACRARTEAQLEAYRALAKAAKSKAAVEAFAPTFFNNAVLALDHCFMHRLRTKEGKDGNPANEVRVLSNSLMENGGRLAPDKTIKLKAETSVLGLEPGDEIALSEDDFARLANAFYAEIEAKFR
jgi:hypothetical protein